MPATPEHPTKDEAAAALIILRELLNEFPFADPASLSVALSALISPVVRGALPVCPLHAITAPVAGSGKSYIVDLAAAISTGQLAPVLSAGKNEEETSKRICAALLDGQQIISIDNVNGDLGGDMLCQAVERPVVALRPLGRSELVRVESRATWFATGNNIRLLGDMTRRVVQCSLDPNVERPELRVFNSRPLEAVLADRGRYVAAALVITRAYLVAGCPDPRPPIGSFESWSRIVRSALVWLGMDDPLQTMENARRIDPVITDLRNLLAAWHSEVGSEGKTTGEIIDIALAVDLHHNRAHEDLFQAILAVAENRRGDPDSRRLGRYLTGVSGRVAEGLRLHQAHDTHAKQKVWSVRRV